MQKGTATWLAPELASWTERYFRMLGAWYSRPSLTVEDVERMGQLLAAAPSTLGSFAGLLGTRDLRVAFRNAAAARLKQLGWEVLPRDDPRARWSNRVVPVAGTGNWVAALQEWVHLEAEVRSRGQAPARAYLVRELWHSFRAPADELVTAGYQIQIRGPVPPPVRTLMDLGTSLRGQVNATTAALVDSAAEGWLSVDAPDRDLMPLVRALRALHYAAQGLEPAAAEALYRVLESLLEAAAAEGLLRRDPPDLRIDCTLAELPSTASGLFEVHRIAGGQRGSGHWELPLVLIQTQKVLPGAIHVELGRAQEWLPELDDALDAANRLGISPDVVSALDAARMKLVRLHEKGFDPTPSAERVRRELLPGYELVEALFAGQPDLQQDSRDLTVLTPLWRALEATPAVRRGEAPRASVPARANYNRPVTACVHVYRWPLDFADGTYREGEILVDREGPAPEEDLLASFTELARSVPGVAPKRGLDTAKAELRSHSSDGDELDRVVTLVRTVAQLQPVIHSPTLNHLAPRRDELYAELTKVCHRAERRVAGARVRLTQPPGRIVFEEATTPANIEVVRRCYSDEVEGTVLEVAIGGYEIQLPGRAPDLLPLQVVLSKGKAPPISEHSRAVVERLRALGEHRAGENLDELVTRLIGSDLEGSTQDTLTDEAARALDAVMAQHFSEQELLESWDRLLADLGLRRFPEQLVPLQRASPDVQVTPVFDRPGAARQPGDTVEVLQFGYMRGEAIVQGARVGVWAGPAFPLAAFGQFQPDPASPTTTDWLDEYTKRAASSEASSLSMRASSAISASVEGFERAGMPVPGKPDGAELDRFRAVLNDIAALETVDGDAYGELWVRFTAFVQVNEEVAKIQPGGHRKTSHRWAEGKQEFVKTVDRIEWLGQEVRPGEAVRFQPMPDAVRMFRTVWQGIGAHILVAGEPGGTALRQLIAKVEAAASVAERVEDILSLDRQTLSRALFYWLGDLQELSGLLLMQDVERCLLCAIREATRRADAYEPPGVVIKLGNILRENASLLKDVGIDVRVPAQSEESLEDAQLQAVARASSRLIESGAPFVVHGVPGQRGRAQALLPALVLSAGLQDTDDAGGGPTDIPGHVLVGLGIQESRALAVVDAVREGLRDLSDGSSLTVECEEIISNIEHRLEAMLRTLRTEDPVELETFLIQNVLDAVDGFLARVFRSHDAGRVLKPALRALTGLGWTDTSPSIGTPLGALGEDIKLEHVVAPAGADGLAPGSVVAVARRRLCKGTAPTRGGVVVAIKP